MNKQSHATAMRRYLLRRNYGITPERYDEMFEQQQGLCGICRRPSGRLKPDGSPYRLHIDHDHETGKVRGLLCFACNHGIAMFKHDLDLLESAKRYLRGRL